MRTGEWSLHSFLLCKVARRLILVGEERLKDGAFASGAALFAVGNRSFGLRRRLGAPLHGRYDYKLSFSTPLPDIKRRKRERRGWL